MTKRTGHTCPICHIWTFHRHCQTCGFTQDEAESALLTQLNENEEST